MRRLLLALALCFGQAASAGPLSDLIMANGLFATAQPGDALRYSLSRDGKEAGEIHLSVLQDGADKLLLLERDEGSRAEIARFPATSANPLLLWFLENIVRDMAAQTGGSPFYIRNRIRDALVASEAQPGPDGRITVTLEPFAADPNRDRLGAFAALRLELSVNSDRPGKLLSLKADTGAAPGGYSEVMVLIGEE